MASPLRQSPGAGTKARCAIAASGLARQPRSPKGLGRRIAVGGPGIASACTRLGRSKTFLEAALPAGCGLLAPLASDT